MRLVAPTRTDPVSRSGSQFLGGPLGRWAAVGPWSAARALQVILGAGTVVYLLGMLRTVPCVRINWMSPERYELLCYSDIPILYSLRGLIDGGLPYFNSPATGQPLEYPVLTGMFTWFAALITPGEASTTFYWVNAVLLLAFFLVALAATSMTVPFRVWDGLLVALAPSVLLAGLINWDWLAIALTAVALLAWSRSRPVLSGILFGLAIAAKFYPLLILGPLVILALRRRRLPDAGRTVIAAAATWALVNLPFALFATQGWSYFFTFSSDRGQDFGSVWLAVSKLGWTVPAESLNNVAMAVLAALCLAIAGLIWFAPRPPRLAQVAFLVVAAFVLTNKVYSPQFVLWLLPLAVLARPRWRDILIWQAAEAVYFVAIWWYLVGLTEDAKGLDERTYALTIIIHLVGVLYLVGVVVRDIWWPAHDPVRSDPTYPEEMAGGAVDDPGGGVLDGAPDVRSRLPVSLG